MPNCLPENAKLLIADTEMQSAISLLAKRLNTAFAGELQTTVVLTVMNGGLVFAGQLIPQLCFPIICDYLHATRYSENNASGELEWKAQPSVSLSGRNVIVLDDILDQGVTCAAIKAFCEERGAAQVTFVMMVAKPMSCRKVDIEVDFIGLMIPDEFVFGMGMDYSGLYRNLPAIYFMSSKV